MKNLIITILILFASTVVGQEYMNLPYVKENVFIGDPIYKSKQKAQWSGDFQAGEDGNVYYDTIWGEVETRAFSQDYIKGYNDKPVEATRDGDKWESWEFKETTYERQRQWKIVTDPPMSIYEIRIDGMTFFGWYYINYVKPNNPRWVHEMQAVAKEFAKDIWSEHGNEWVVDNCTVYVGQRTKITDYYTKTNVGMQGESRIEWLPENHWLYEGWRVKNFWKRKGYKMTFRNGRFAWYYLGTIEWW